MSTVCEVQRVGRPCATLETCTARRDIVNVYKASFAARRHGPAPYLSASASAKPRPSSSAAPRSRAPTRTAWRCGSSTWRCSAAAATCGRRRPRGGRCRRTSWAARRGTSCLPRRPQGHRRASGKSRGMLWRGWAALGLLLLPLPPMLRQALAALGLLLLLLAGLPVSLQGRHNSSSRRWQPQAAPPLLLVPLPVALWRLLRMQGQALPEAQWRLTGEARA